MSDTTCTECGMVCAPREYHPYAACLMFKACHDGDAVRANLQAVWDDARAMGVPNPPDGVVLPWWEVLGVPPTADAIAIRQAFNYAQTQDVDMEAMRRAFDEGLAACRRRLRTGR